MADHEAPALPARAPKARDAVPADRGAALTASRLQQVKDAVAGVPAEANEVVVEPDPR